MFAFLDTDSSFDVQPRDIADVIKKSVDVDENMKIMNNKLSIMNNKLLIITCLEQILNSLNVTAPITLEKLE